MKIWIKSLVVIVICLFAISTVYVLKFGFPEFNIKKTNIMAEIFENISQDEEFLKNKEKDDYIIDIELADNTITFNRKFSEQGSAIDSIEFICEKSTITTAIDENKVDTDYAKEVIQWVFGSTCEVLGYSKENAKYSLIDDIVIDKTLEKDGYQLVSQNDVTRLMVSTKTNLNLAQKDEVYIKTEDLIPYLDIIKSKLQYKLIEKPGIVFEKNVSYSKNLVFVIYEKGGLTNRTYTSLMNILDAVVANETYKEYVKANYPVITSSGTLSLKGITISLNEKLGEGNIHYYSKPNDYEYMLIRINLEEM